MASLQEFYNDADVFVMCRDYEYLLKSDPTQDAITVDKDYVDIHPHQLNSVIDLNIYQYKFLARVVKLYLHDRVNLSSFIRIVAL